MKLKRILSSVLVVIMLFSAVSILLPVRAEAAHHDFVSDTRLTTEEVAKIVEDYQKAEYASLEEMFLTDLELGRLDYSTNGVFSIYVNRYTGVVYYTLAVFTVIKGEKVTYVLCCRKSSTAITSYDLKYFKYIVCRKPV